MIDKCGVRGDATLCVVIFLLAPLAFAYWLYNIGNMLFENNKQNVQMQNTQ